VVPAPDLQVHQTPGTDPHGTAKPLREAHPPRLPPVMAQRKGPAPKGHLQLELVTRAIDLAVTHGRSKTAYLASRRPICEITIYGWSTITTAIFRHI
jgi:hypothetical protein